MEWENVPVMPATVGIDRPTRWVYAQYGKFLNIYGIENHITMTFNLNSIPDIEAKRMQLYDMKNRGVISDNELREVEERLRTLSNITVGGKGSQTLAGLQSPVLSEGVKHKKGQKYYTYEDGVKKEHIAKGPRKVVSAEQKKAAENARKYAHTPEADKKRRKSIAARGDYKALGTD